MSEYGFMYMGHAHLHWGATNSRASRCRVAHDGDDGDNVRVRVGVRVRVKARVEASVSHLHHMQP